MKLNSKIDVRAAKKRFSKTGRVQITDILDVPSAEKLHGILVDKTAWMLNYNLGDEVVCRELQDFRSMTTRSVKKILNQMYEAASTGAFQYVRHSRGVKPDPVNCLPIDPGLIEYFDFLESKDVTDLIKKITGKAVTLTGVAAQWYKPENFQTKGSDTPEETLGFALILAKSWVADWGGNTIFYDDDGTISEVFVPAYNSLELFDGKTHRSISDITNFSREFRVSVAGSYS